MALEASGSHNLLVIRRLLINPYVHNTFVHLSHHSYVCGCTHRPFLTIALKVNPY